MTTGWDRIGELLVRYSAPSASAAQLLCDRHEPSQLAFRIVAPDLAAHDLSYGELRDESTRLAAGLAALGVKPGDRVATLMGKSRAYVITLLAIWRLGAVHVPLFTAFAPPAIVLRLASSACALVVCDGAQRAKLAPSIDIPADAPWRLVTTGASDAGAVAWNTLLVDSAAAAHPAVQGGDGALIQIYTSGTTGKPKGVQVPLRALAALQAYAEFGLDLRAADVYWNAADPGWAYGLYYAVLASLATGVPGLLFEGSFSPEATYAILARHGVTNLAAAPTVFRALRAAPLEPPRDLRLRCISSAGEPLTPEVNDWATRALGAPVHDHYGQTEGGMIINNHHHPALRRLLKPGSMGRAMPGWTATVLKLDADTPAAIGELGRVAVDRTQSPLCWFSGYVGEPLRSAEKFSPDGRWYYTGDTARLDADGDFFFAARDDDVIIMAGYRIGPFEIESVLCVHPAVAECAVVAVPDEIRGEVLEVVVVLRPGHVAGEELSLELQHWVKRRYAAHAYPRRVHYAASLPKTPSGKLQRFVVRQQLRGQA